MTTQNSRISAPLPINISFDEWSSQIRVGLPEFSFPNPHGVKNWWEWASFVVENNELQNIPFPTKLGYPQEEDWRKWASYFVNSIYN